MIHKTPIAKRHHIVALLLFALASCNGDGKKNTASADTSETAKQPAAWSNVSLLSQTADSAYYSIDGQTIALPATYDSLMQLAPGFPIFKVKDGNDWAVVEINGSTWKERLTCSRIEPCTEPQAADLTWTLYHDYEEDGKIETWMQFLRFYQDEDSIWRFYTSDTPYVPLLDDDLRLSYTYNGPADIHLDRLLQRMMYTLWDKADDETFPEFYERWTNGITAAIDSLYEAENLFRQEGTNRYEQAMSELVSYISSSFCGSQAEMNSASYVSAITQCYLMTLAEQQLAQACPQVGVPQERVSWSKYMSAREDMEHRIDEANGNRYSSYPMEVNDLSEHRFIQRKTELEELGDVMLHQKAIKQKALRPSEEQIKSYFHELTPGILYPARADGDPEPIFYSDTVGTYLLQWVELREHIASHLPKSEASSYRNQTTNIILTETGPTYNLYE